MTGYILLSRGVLNSDIWSKPPLYMKVWIYLLTNANYKDYGNLKRGQLFTSIPEIQRACSYKVGYRTVEPTKKEIWGILEFLRNPGEGNDEGNTKEPMIETMKVTHGMVVTICKYNDYQNPRNYEGNSESNDEGTAKELRRKRQGNNINKQDKRNNELINSSSTRAREGDGYTNIWNSLRPHEIDILGEIFEEHIDLIDAVHDEVVLKRKIIHNPYRYIAAYGERSGWPKK